MVARQGFAAMLNSEGDVVTGWQDQASRGNRQRHACRNAG